MYSVVTKNVDNTTTTTNNEQNTEKCNADKCQENIEPAIDNIQIDNGHVNANDKRRDSTQVWTPLLENGSQNKMNLANANHHHTNESSDAIYSGEVSNNNDWNGDKLKTNGLENSLNRSNNNGPAINGKTAAALIDKCDEHDPLTGLYKEKPDQKNYSDDVNFAGEEGCGLFGCKPKWARSFASTHMFMVVFLVAYILQGMYMTYFVSVITTIEKLFQIKSKTTGFLLSASEMGQISTAMLLTYYAGRGHRPRWIACGMVLFSIAAFACALPHFIFGEELIQSTALMSKNSPINSTNTDLPSTLAFHMNELSHNTTSSMMMTSTPRHIEMNLCHVDDYPQNSTAECNEDRKLEQVSHSKITVIVLCIFFGSLLSSGIGQTAVSTLGIPYIDDNVASKQSAMYMAITIGVRILGPASGFIVGSVCTRWYVNFTNPGFDASDPRWIGAWWLGPVVIGSLMLLSSIAMFSFPKQLRGKKSAPGAAKEKSVAAKEPVEPEEKPRLKDFPKTVKRQLSNDILMFRTASCVFHLLPIAGLYTFLPKYLETQFRLAPYDANMVAAFCGILVMGIGIVVSGLVIFKFKPTARAVAAWIALTALIYSAGMVILMFVGCNMYDFAGYKPATSSSPAVIEPVCNAVLNCTCDKEQFAPICGIDGKIYISSCHAGCSSAGLRMEDNHTVFSECSCIEDAPIGNNSNSYEAFSGYCDNNCKNFIIFIIIFAVCVFMHSTSEVGSMLLVMRCTHPKDKAMAMGLIQSAIGLFGNVPCPIIYGAVVDSACLIWRSVCGKHGACSLYDADTFRHYFLGITAGIMFLAFIMDLVVWSKAHRIDIAPEENAEKKSPESECQKSMATAPDTSV
ncbi:solute carrier organic anion transporter family member 74D [Lucilia sericata]|uniref:solute carrier organic anion transporter family member 74D n=1 Tax=Lucilia sericata TaxID=13632 RepID=UPI0018A7FB41|nr:solute carrier organic anion transporter family member 74D [Lucilia sericata]XP_037817049.1 solute carrier organic anion transporter family member 74D [Lucilia sericata]XP_037817050.1 solute carrier organic anion transporter family member 74D [Lucilia sericata]